jgi:four helix bundle protein
MKENVIVKKSYEFAVNSLKAVRLLNKSVENYVLVKQFIRAATSIGSNIEESQGGESKKDFVHKLYISYKEAKECKYWIRLIKDSQLKNSDEIKIFKKLYDDADELCKILYSIINNSKI